jgi:hypothetical protein
MRPLVLVLLALLAVAPAGARADDTGPPLSVPAADLAKALDCPHSLSGVTRAPVLLIPGTNLEPKANFDWNYEPALDAAHIPWCAVTLPRYAMGDIQVSAEYVVAALRRMHADAGRRVSVIGYSQGGMIGRWALKWWPDTRGMVEDLIGNAPSNHGTLTARPACSAQCPPADWQQRDDSNFIKALNTGPETYAGIDYTVNFTHTDEVVTPNTDAQTGSSALRTGDGRIRNTALQDICPNDTADHLVIGSYDPVAWALALDALTHDGPADPARIDPGVCAQQFMPGVDPSAFPQNWSRYLATIGQGQQQADQLSAEPPLRCYAGGRCPPQESTGTSGAGAQSHRCASRRRVTLHLDRRLTRATVTVGAKHVHVRRRRGRLVATVDLTGRRAGTVTVRIRGRRADGRRVTTTRRFRLCARRH